MFGYGFFSKLAGVLVADVLLKGALLCGVPIQAPEFWNSLRSTTAAHVCLSHALSIAAWSAEAVATESSYTSQKPAGRCC